MNNIPIVWITENIKHEFAFRIFTSNRKISNSEWIIIIDWCKDNFYFWRAHMTGASSRYKDAFYFKNEQDRLIFFLKFSGLES